MRRFAACMIMILIGLAASAGCDKTHTKTLQDVMDDMTGATSKAEVESKVSGLYDPNNPDRVREGVEYLTKTDWGLKEPYLAKYASLAAEHEDDTVRAAAVRALGRSGDAGYLPVLVKAVVDKSATVRWDAVRSLDGKNSTDIEAAFIHAATEDQSNDVRSSAAKALRCCHTAQAASTLLQCMSDPAFAVRYEARKSLAAITGNDFEYDAQAWSDAIAGKPLPANAGSKRPWWDWFGLTDSRPAAEQTNANPSTGSSASSQPATSQPAATQPSTPPSGS